MAAIIGASVLAIVILVSILIICGMPLGQLVMGGRFRVFSKKWRLLLAVQLVLQLFFVVIILQTGGFMPLWFSASVTRSICIVMAAYLTLNTLLNLLSKSKPERYLMTPLSALASLCFYISAL